MLNNLLSESFYLALSLSPLGLWKRYAYENGVFMKAVLDE